jgi:hypothetical protein
MLYTFKRVFLVLLLGLTGWTALLVASALFRTGIGAETLAPALKTTLVQGVLLLVSFAAFAALDQKSLRLMAATGLMAAALMLALVPVFAWGEITEEVYHSWLSQPVAHRRMLQAVETGVLTAGLLCLVPFVLIPRVKRVAQIVQSTTVLYLTVAYLTALLHVWNLDSQRVAEALATLLIPAGACMLGVFALHKFFEIRPPDPLTAVREKISIRCPRCQCAQEVAMGDSRCVRCRLRLHIEAEEPVCPNCHFNLHNLTRPRCPECGMQLDQEEVLRGEAPE